MYRIIGTVSYLKKSYEDNLSPAISDIDQGD